MYDGITGIFMEPYSHGRRDKVIGVISGLGIGALSFIANLTSGQLGPVNESIVQQLTRLMKEPRG